MILCWRTVRVPSDERQAFIDWIDHNGPVRRQHGILFELVLGRSPRHTLPKRYAPTTSTSTRRSCSS